jgi:hypothetical protein
LPEIRYESCAVGFYCDADHYGGEEFGACQPKKPIGGQCKSFYECAAGLLCIDVLWLDSGYDRISGSCGEPGALGDSCNPEAAENQCDVGLYCEGASQTCKQRPDDGDACTQEARCLYGLYCDGWQDGVCRPKKLPGEECSSDNECWYSDCSNGTCYQYECVP